MSKLAVCDPRDPDGHNPNTGRDSYPDFARPSPLKENWVTLRNIWLVSVLLQGPSLLEHLFLELGILFENIYYHSFLLK